MIIILEFVVLARLQCPIKVLSWNALEIKHLDDQQVFHSLIIRLLFEIKLEYILAKWIEKLRSVSAKFARASQDLVAADLIKLIADGSSVVNPLQI